MTLLERTRDNPVLASIAGFPRPQRTPIACVSVLSVLAVPPKRDSTRLPEAKLLRIPVGDAALRAQVRRFERERDCRAVGVRASGADFAEAARLATPLALAVEEDEAVRAGHLVLVGGN